MVENCKQELYDLQNELAEQTRLNNYLVDNCKRLQYIIREIREMKYAGYNNRLRKEAFLAYKTYVQQEKSRQWKVYHFR